MPSIILNCGGRYYITGKLSEFGGPNDSGMENDEGVALYSDGTGDPFALFADNANRLGQNLNPEALYCAMRWNYRWGGPVALRACVVHAMLKGGSGSVMMHPVDWGPAEDTGRIIDVSPGAMNALGAETDDKVIVTIYGGDGKLLAL